MSLMNTPLTPRFHMWCAETGTTPTYRGDMVAIPHTLQNRHAMDSFCDYKVASIRDGVIWLRPRRGNEIY
jgi:mannitol/fructose-specific phosphotransferase system IIA component